MYENSLAAKQAVIESRKKLQLPPHENAVWEGIPTADRHILCRSAHVPASRVNEPWHCLTPCERRSIREAAERASKWARNLGLFTP